MILILTGYIGAYNPEQRKLRIEKFFGKRNSRVWTKKIKYDVRKNFADSRIRKKGRFVKKEEEEGYTIPETEEETERKDREKRQREETEREERQR
jgi:hypothetical protein